MVEVEELMATCIHRNRLDAMVLQYLRAAGISDSQEQSLRATLKSNTLNARAEAEEGTAFDSPTALEPCSKRPRGDERSGPHPEQACASGGSTDLNVNDLVSFLAPVGAGRVTKVRNDSEGGGSDIEFDDRTMKNLESRFVRQITLGQDSTLNPGTMNVEVRSFGGLSVSLLIDVYATISDLKHEIEQYMQIPTVEQRIVVGKTQLMCDTDIVALHVSRFRNVLNVLRVKPQFLLSGRGDGDSAVKLWDVSTGTLVREMNHHHLERIVAVSTNWGTMQAYSISQSTKLILWDLATGKCVNACYMCEHEDLDLTTAEIHWKGDGCQVVGGLRVLRFRVLPSLGLLEVECGLARESFVCRVFDAFEEDDEVVCIAVDWETMTVLSSSQTRLILLDLRVGQEVRGFVGHRGAVTCLRVDSASQRFLSASYDGSVMLWDIASGTCLKTYHMDRGCRDFVSVFCVCWHTLHAVCGYESGLVELRSFDSDPSVTVLRKELRGSSISCIAVDWAREKFVISFKERGCLVASDLTSRDDEQILVAHRLSSPVVCL